MTIREATIEGGVENERFLTVILDRDQAYYKTFHSKEISEKERELFEEEVEEFMKTNNHKIDEEGYAKHSQSN